MIVDQNKVNLLEEDIEEYLYRNPAAVPGSWMSGQRVDRWLARQLRVPSGIIDLLGMCSGYRETLVVVEVKNVDVTPSALTQVCRYAADISGIGYHALNGRVDGDSWDVHKVVVGPSIDDQVFIEASAVGVQFVKFDVRLSLDTNAIGWSNDYLDETGEQYRQLSGSQVFSPFIEAAVLRADAEGPDIGDYDPVSEFEEAIKNATSNSRQA